MKTTRGITGALALLLTCSLTAISCKNVGHGSRDDGASRRAGSARSSSGRGDSTARPTKSSYSSGRGSASASRGSSGAGVQEFSLALPTGDPDTSAVMLTKAVPAEVIAGQPFEYSLEVTNLTDIPLSDVKIFDSVSEGYTPASAKPEWASNRDGQLAWAIGSLGAGQTRLVMVSGTAAAVGNLGACSTVSYSSGVCSTVAVVKPDLQLRLEGPGEALVCDDLTFRYVVKNAGSGVARGVKITNQSPPALISKQGFSTFRLNVGDLAAGETKTVAAPITAKSTGEFVTAATATAEGGLSAESNRLVTTVRQPKLEVEIKAAQSAFIDRPFTHEITVKNVGSGIAADTKLESTLSTGSRILRADGSPRTVGGKSVWSIGTLRPSQSRTVKVSLASSSRSISNSVRATALCATPVSKDARTNVKGIPAILLEVVDLSDPIVVGEDETYQIRVTNQGTAPGTNIRIACTLDEAMQYVRSSGPTAGKPVQGVLTFAPLASLAPKEETTWSVVVRANEQRDARFKVELKSDQITRPVEETEATNFYR